MFIQLWVKCPCLLARDDWLGKQVLEGEERDADEERSVLIFVLNFCCMSSPSAFGFKSDVLLTWKKKS